MSPPPSVDLRDRVVAAVAAGASRHRGAACFGASVSSVSRWLQRSHQEGHVAHNSMGRDHTSKRIEGYAALILTTSKQEPRLFLYELRELLVSRACRPARAARRASSSDTRSPGKGATHAAEHEHDEVRAAREAWFEAQPELDLNRLVFLEWHPIMLDHMRRNLWRRDSGGIRLA